MAHVVSKNPELRRYRSVLLDLAYEEYCLRRQAGETLDAEEFSRRFPSFQQSLLLLIEVHSLLDQESEIRRGPETIAWPEPGSHFLGFDLIDEIGRGTFGRVYLASEPALGGRPVALKVAFQGGREAEILGRLRHPNIVAVHSIQYDDQTGLTAFCMPYLGLVTLADLLDQAFLESTPPCAAHKILKILDDINKNTDLPAADPDRIFRTGSYVNGIIHLAGQLADALAYAHERGVYHRDLKPSNVLLAPDGRPLLLDFNLSFDERLPPSRVGGTLPYMAPEELLAFAEESTEVRRHYDPRSDLFSLGVILYELLAGHHPFDKIPWGSSFTTTAIALHQKQVVGPRPLQQANPQVDPRLAGLIECCLAPNPDDRPQTVSELASLLHRELTFWRRGRRWVRSHRLLVGGIVSLLAVFAVVLGVVFAMRLPYSIRQYECGLAESRQGAYREAIESFSSALRADPDLYDVLVARAEANHRLGDFQMAFADYQAAHRKAPSPWLDLLRGYCRSRLGDNLNAMVLYQSAEKAGETSPALFNNLGYTYRQLNRIPEAETTLRRALELDDGLQAPHHNLVLIYMHRALQGQPIPEVAIEHAQRAMAIGPPSADLYRNVAVLYAVAAEHDRTRVQPAIEYIRRAVERGASPKELVAIPAFAVLKMDSTFMSAIEQLPGENSPPADYLVDPLPVAVRAE